MRLRERLSKVEAGILNALRPVANKAIQEAMENQPWNTPQMTTDFALTLRDLQAQIDQLSYAVNEVLDKLARLNARLVALELGKTLHHDNCADASHVETNKTEPQNGNADGERADRIKAVPTGAAH